MSLKRPAAGRILQQIFLCHRKLRPMTQKRSAKDRTAAEWKSVAKATRRRRRILSRILFLLEEENKMHVGEILQADCANG